VLVDYDVCSNWGNWVAAAGLTGGRINHFNITKQSKVLLTRSFFGTSH
jgi:deoxyribodipyrimidine photo-lyase